MIQVRQFNQSVALKGSSPQEAIALYAVIVLNGHRPNLARFREVANGTEKSQILDLTSKQ